MRRLAIALLDDDNGISRQAWEILSELLDSEPDNSDIFDAVRCDGERYYLPKDCGISP